MTNELNWQKAQEKAQGWVSAWKAEEPGGAVIGFDRQGIRFALAGGLESLATLQPFSPDSVVRYASVTKHAFCSMVLANPHAIALDDRLGDHLTELQAPLADVTVGRALDMSGGLPDTRECLTLLGLSVYTSTEAKPLLDFLARQTRLNFEAGTEVSYSNTGYRLVEAALERKGLFFKDYIRAAGQDVGATFDAPDVWHDPVRGLAPGYWDDGRTWQLSAAGLHISASGSMTGSALSLTRWLQALLVEEKVLGRLAERRFLKNDRPSGYGLGIAETILGERRFIGHGGSHPGYKTYFLLDAERKLGFVIVSNREDTNGSKIAQEAMAALQDLPLPTPAALLKDGFYLAEDIASWMVVKGAAAAVLDAEDALYDDDGGWVSSRSSTSPLRLTMEGEAIVGEVGHAARRYLPISDEPLDPSFHGRWDSPEGASLILEDGAVTMGIGPTRRRMPLKALGRDCFLFWLQDGPWSKRVLLHVMDGQRLELILSRARMIEYHRAN
ncbi:serine hydrolase domain-containing protein [Rhizobium paknamense]|uniref:CubicO group peptidase (Beta-lactamase class C family) n=1 Tax=Rhizobium paknamense TaxID=1206817 RepID=A0ABU0II29_9HYPH|nr:serine hydrolase domain-containing protein [Rhizobium paknamense]MDQ0457887.1 CubicO group peptidase (beta-lactamase class C family) [Rhizobium paknamense]